MTRGCARVAVLLCAASALLLGSAGAASAHPLGNFTVNQFSGLTVGPQSIDVRRVIDLAEIPTVQERRSVDTDRDGELSGPELDIYRDRRCLTLAGETTVALDGVQVRLSVMSSEVTLPAGQAGLDTLRLDCLLRGELGPLGSTSELTYSADSFPGRVGWREVVAVGDGVTLDETDVPATSPSRALTSYPDDLLSSPLKVTAARIALSPGGRRLAGGSGFQGSGGLLPRGVDRLGLRLTSLVSDRDLTIGFALVALGAAFLLGAGHALSPGHGKTVMAAYLVGQRGTARQAGLIGLTVTATHTIGVVLLGTLVSLSTAIAPERILPWLSVASGLLLAVVGFGLLRSAVRTQRARRAEHVAHHHDHDHDHEDGPDWHSHGGSRHRHAPLPQGALHWRGLVALGLAGGLVPSPAALVVLLGAIAIGRAWFGVVLVLGFGVGMATTLVAVGLLLERGRRILDRRAASRGPRAGRLPAALRLVPVVTAGVVVVIGISVASRGALLAVG